MLVLVPVFLLPTLFLLSQSFTAAPAGLSHYQELFGSQLFWSVLGRSFVIAGIVTVLSLVIGLPYASVANSAGPRLRTLLYGAVIASLFFSVIVRAYAWLALLGDGGPIHGAIAALGIPAKNIALVNSPTGVVIGMVQYGVPYMVLAIADVMRRIDASYDRAAATLGAGPARRWLQIKLPMLMPGITAGCTIVFVTTLGYFIIPTVLGSPKELMIGGLISGQVGTTMNWGLGAAMATVLLVVTMALVLAMQMLGRRLGRQS
jgi:ABC-type spermidine/putrescine transport system permease subunit I